MLFSNKILDRSPMYKTYTRVASPTGGESLTPQVPGMPLAWPPSIWLHTPLVLRAHSENSLSRLGLPVDRGHGGPEKLVTTRVQRKAEPVPGVALRTPAPSQPSPPPNALSPCPLLRDRDVLRSPREWWNRELGEKNLRSTLCSCNKPFRD